MSRKKKQKKNLAESPKVNSVKNIEGDDEGMEEMSLEEAQDSSEAEAMEDAQDSSEAEAMEDAQDFSEAEVVEATQDSLETVAMEEVGEESIGFSMSEDSFVSEDVDSLDGEELTDSEEAISEAKAVSLGGTELEDFESAEIEEREVIYSAQVLSVLEALLFSSDKPRSIAMMKQVFKGTNIQLKEIKEALKELAEQYADPSRGVTLEEVSGGYQIRTKLENVDFLKRMVKVRPFKLSGPALEVLAIVAYKQPCIKMHVDEIRGVESGHLLRGLMDRSLINFAGKSEHPGKPMLYATSKKFLEIFGLRNLRELPTMSEIEDLIPEGIGNEEEEERETLDQISDSMSQEGKATYSDGEEELGKIQDQLSGINTSSEFFAQEKQRAKERKEAEKAQDIKEAMVLGDEVTTRNKNWLERYELALEEKVKQAQLESQSPSESESKSESESESESALESTSQSESELEFTSESQLESASQSSSFSDSASQSESESLSELESTPQLESESEPESSDEFVVEPISPLRLVTESESDSASDFESKSEDISVDSESDFQLNASPHLESDAESESLDELQMESQFENEVEPEITVLQDASISENSADFGEFDGDLAALESKPEPEPDKPFD